MMMLKNGNENGLIHNTQCYSNNPFLLLLVYFLVPERESLLTAAVHTLLTYL